MQKDKQNYLYLQQVFKNSLKTYGYRRLKIALKQEKSINFSALKILKLMKKYSLIIKYNKRKTNFQKPSWQKSSFPNLINQNFHTEKTWYTDTSNLIFNNQKHYISVIIDGKSRNILSYHISKKLDWTLIRTSLSKAIKQRLTNNKIIIHSDQGCVYTSKNYQNYCQKNNMLISMSRKGNPIDNAPVESFFSLLKKEVLYNNKFNSMWEYLKKVKQWLKFYSTKRISLNKN